MADIVLKDRDGKDVTYTGIQTVTFDTTTEGEQATFTEGVAVEDTPIMLDLSEGDQQVTMPEGYLAKSAVIKKPDELVAENIRKGVTIAGVTGDMEADTEDVTVELNFPATMVEADIFPEQTMQFDTANAVSGGYMYLQTDLFSLKDGETYYVCWNNEEYVLTAYSAVKNEHDVILIGCESYIKGESADFAEPFIIYQVLEKNYCVFLSVGDTEPTSHTVRVYQMVRDNSDQVVEPSEEKLLSKVTITKPDDLIPENVRAGVDIGGVEGEFIGDTEETTVELNFPASTAEMDILQETTYSGFAPNESFGAYAYDINPAPFALAVGEEYVIVWDGEAWPCVGQDLSVMMDGSVGLGNLASIGGTGNEEPFAIGWSSSGVTILANNDATSHTVRIYQVVEDGHTDQVVEPSTDGKVISKMTIKKPESLVPENIRDGVEIGGVTGEYITPGTTKEIEPDFSAGDHVVTADGDERWNKVAVKMPETLIPENIADGVDIAGIVGAFLGGGGKVCCSYGDVTGTGAAMTIEHRLGVVPDIVIFWRYGTPTTTAYYHDLFFGVSTALQAVMGGPIGTYGEMEYGYGIRTAKASTSSSNYLISRGGASISIDTESTSSYYIHSANEISFKVGNSGAYPQSGSKYKWIAIGGLT